MTPASERRKDYQELAEIKIQLAIVITEMKNVVEALQKHQADDVKVADRVSVLENYIATLNGKIAAYSKTAIMVYTAGGSAASIVVGAFLKSKGVL